MPTRCHAGDAAVFSTATLAPVARTRAAHMVFTTAVAFDPAETALLSVSADASARVTTVRSPSRTGLSLGSLLLLLLALLALAVAAVWWLGLDERAAALLSSLGVRPGSHTEL